MAVHTAPQSTRPDDKCRVGAQRACSSNCLLRSDLNSRPMKASEGAAAGGKMCLYSGATRMSSAAPASAQRVRALTYNR